VLIGLLLGLLALGLEVGIAMGLAAAVGLVFMVDKPLVQMAWSAWESLNSFTLLAMPLFIFMGAMFSHGGALHLMFAALDKWLGWLPGGLASVVIAANGLFGAVSGSSVAAAATFSMIAYPEMEKRGYDPKLSLGSIAVGGTLSVLVPPSLILIVYGSWENVSIAQLFAAAVVPGAMLMLLLMLSVVLMVKLRPELAPRSAPASWKERLLSIGDMVPWLLVVVLVMGSIFGGLMTPTEASGLGAVLSLVVAWYYGNLSYRMTRDALLSAVKVTAMLAFIIVAARLLSFVFQDLGATAKLSSAVLGMELGTYGTMLAIVVLYLILGMFFDSMAMMLLTLSFVVPIVLKLGYDPIWWGVTFVLLAEIGLVTPPFGLNLFTINGVLPKFSVMTIARASLPFLAVMLLMIALLIVFPQIALWLPRRLY
jgi:C4-dicarboxylate transporter, DctM subunit